MPGDNNGNLITIFKKKVQLSKFFVQVQVLPIVEKYRPINFRNKYKTLKSNLITKLILNQPTDVWFLPVMY